MTGPPPVAHPASADVDSVSGTAAASLIALAYVTPEGIADSAVEPSDSYGFAVPGPHRSHPSRQMSTPCWIVGLVTVGTRGGGVAGENHLGSATSDAGALDVTVGTTSIGVVSSTCTADGNSGLTDASVAGALGAYTPLEPARILDTRSGAAIPAGGTVDFPSGTARPLASDLNDATGESRANLVVVQVGANGKVGLFRSTQAHVVFGVAGTVGTGSRELMREAAL